MKEKLEAVIAVPFCEKEYDILVDTIKSIEFYVQEQHHIIAIDDHSPSKLDEKLRKEMPHITVLRNPRQHGGRSGLYITQAAAIKYALEHFDFKVFIKMDTDALIIGPSLVSEAICKFKLTPKAGLLGSYRFRADQQQRNWYMWKLVLLYESSLLRRLLGKPVLWRQMIKEARKVGYDLGENVLGGSYIFSADCLKEMHRRGYLDYEYEKVLTQSKLGEDVIYGLFCRAAGYRICDFGMKNDPMVIALDFFPMSKEEAVLKKKSIIHSVKKGKDNETQDELREYFRLLRK